VFTYTDEPAASSFWFKPDTRSAIRGSFVAAGYKSVGNTDLAAALSSPVTKVGRRIIVLADSRLPDGVGERALKSYLDGGGILVLLGVNPLIYTFDADGAPAGIDDSRAKAAFGIDPPDRQRDFGNNVSAFSTAAFRLGLNGHFIASGWANPAQVSTVLASDRSGNATAWIKQFAKGGLLIQLPVPRYRPTDLSRYVNAIDLAASQASAPAH